MSEKKMIDFMGLRKIAMLLSTVFVLVSIGSLATKQVAFGLDFTGGTVVEVAYEQPVNVEEVRQQLVAAGYDKVVVLLFGSDREVLIRLPQGVGDKAGDKIITELRTKASVELRRIEFVGPQVGEELKEQGGLAMLAALAVVMVYVAVRFQFKFAVGAVSALIHDVLIVLGVFSALQLDFDLTVLAALLAVIGYSLNDTIVVSDRIRENFRMLVDKQPIEVVNISLNETLGRTVITSLTTLLVLTALYIFGGEIIHNFALALLIGVVVGTYSSIYVAANTILAMNVSREDLIVQQLEDFDDEWNYVGNKKSATYTNLDPGNYTFKVKASNNDGKWNEKGIRLTIVVVPRIWKRTWFRFLLLFVILTTIILFYINSVNRIKEQKIKLEKEPHSDSLITITGKVIDEETKEPLIGVTLAIKNTVIGTITNVEGNFILKNISQKIITLQISYTGYETQEITLTERQRNQQKFVLNPVLLNSDAHISTFYVTVKRTPWQRVKSKIRGIFRRK